MTWTKQLLTAIAEQLHADGAAVWKPAGGYISTDIAIVFGALPSTPDRAIALAAYGVDQGADDPVNTDGTQGVQLRMRGIPANPTSVDDIADDAYDALQGLKLPAVGVLLMKRKLQAPMGQDGNRRWERADSYELLTHRPTKYRPG